MPLHETPIEFRSGLVDPAALLEYMDDCHCAELNPPREPGNHELEFHHLYFPRQDFRNDWAPLPFRRLRNSRYNLIEILNCQEDLYHQDTASEVPQDELDLDAANAFLEEDECLTNYAGTSWLVATMQDRLDNPHGLGRLRKTRLGARLAILNEMMRTDADRVGRIEVMHPAIVNGALSKYLAQQREEGLELMLNERLSAGGVIIPTKIYGADALHNKTDVRLRKKVEAQNWVFRRMMAVPMLEIA